MKSERDKERRREKQRRERRENTSTLRLDRRVMIRCPTCRALVKPPCQLCYIRALKGMP